MQGTGDTVATIPTLACFLLLSTWVCAALSDLRSMTIPNSISIAMIAGFVLLAPFSDVSWQAALYSLLAALLTFAVCFVLFAANVMGGGDAKLLTASALWFGLTLPLITFFVHTALLGGILTIIILFLRSKNPWALTLAAFLPDSLTNGKKVPYGLAIAASGIININSNILIQL